MNKSLIKSTNYLTLEIPFCGSDAIQNPRFVVLNLNVYSIVESCSVHINCK